MSRTCVCWSQPIGRAQPAVRAGSMTVQTGLLLPVSPELHSRQLRGVEALTDDRYLDKMTGCHDIVMKLILNMPTAILITIV